MLTNSPTVLHHLHKHYGLIFFLEFGCEIDPKCEIFHKADREIKNISVPNNYKDIKKLVFQKYDEWRPEQKEEIFQLTQSMVRYWKRVRKMEVRDHIDFYNTLVHYYDRDK